MSGEREGPEPADDAAARERAARIVAGYRDRHSVTPEQLSPLVDEVQEALRDFGETTVAPSAAPAPRHRRAGDVDTDRAVRFWQRLVLAAIAGALAALILQRLAWVG
jgi:predicted transcriptional regulator